MKGYTRGDASPTECEVSLDGKLLEKVTLSPVHHDRRTQLFWNYDLEPGPHRLEIRKVAGNETDRIGPVLVYK